jgi:hypothetical protein
MKRPEKPPQPLKCFRIWRSRIDLNTCPHWGDAGDRQENAAKNILQLGLRTVGHAETYTLEENFPPTRIGPVRPGRFDELRIPSGVFVAAGGECQIEYNWRSQLRG